jgi:hypothetical protein
MDSVAFITCVLHPEEYRVCRDSILALEPAGVTVAIEAVDNTGNRLSSPAALNQGWERARAEILVFCHEDVVFPRDWLTKLRAAVQAVGEREGEWAVLGPMGRAGKRFFGRALDSEGRPAYFGSLPALVETLDEFCLVVPRALPLRFDARLGGHHLYGADLCLQALEAGYLNYAIDAPCRHDSATRHRPLDYHPIKRRLQRKWMFRRRRVGRSIGTTCGRIRFGLFEGWL